MNNQMFTRKRSKSMDETIEIVIIPRFNRNDDENEQSQSELDEQFINESWYENESKSKNKKSMSTFKKLWIGFMIACIGTVCISKYYFSKTMDIDQANGRNLNSVGQVEDEERRGGAKAGQYGAVARSVEPADDGGEGGSDGDVAVSFNVFKSDRAGVETGNIRHGNWNARKEFVSGKIWVEDDFKLYEFSRRTPADTHGWTQRTCTECRNFDDDNDTETYSLTGYFKEFNGEYKLPLNRIRGRQEGKYDWENGIRKGEKCDYGCQKYAKCCSQITGCCGCCKKIRKKIKQKWNDAPRQVHIACAAVCVVLLGLAWIISCFASSVGCAASEP